MKALIVLALSLAATAATAQATYTIQGPVHCTANASCGNIPVDPPDLAVSYIYYDWSRGRIAMSADGTIWDSGYVGLSGLVMTDLPLYDATGRVASLTITFSHSSRYISSGRAHYYLQIWGIESGSIVMPYTCQRDLGFGGPGEARLTVCGGDLSTGNPAPARLRGAAPLQPAMLVLGTQNQPTAWFGGTLLPLPVLATVAMTTDAAGEATMLMLPGGLGPAVLYAQCAFLDPTSPSGVGLSNALELALLQ